MGKFKIEIVLAMVIPIPLEEPVMIITFPFNLFIYYLLFLLVSVNLQLTSKSTQRAALYQDCFFEVKNRFVNPYMISENSIDTR
jgi:hypothetical protein